MFDPSVIASGAPLPAVDPEQFRRAFQIAREKHEQNKAMGLAAFAGSGVPVADHMEIFFRCTLLLMALDRGEFVPPRAGLHQRVQYLEVMPNVARYLCISTPRTANT